MSAIASCAPCTALRVQFHPAGIRQFDKTAGGGGEPFQIRLGKFQAFRLPFGGDGQPVNAAALDDEARLELARREEQAVKRRVAEKFRLRRAGCAQASASEPRKFSFASPIHKPGSCMNQSSLRSHWMAGSSRGIIENFRLVAGAS